MSSLESLLAEYRRNRVYMRSINSKLSTYKELAEKCRVLMKKINTAEKEKKTIISEILHLK